MNIGGLDPGVTRCGVAVVQDGRAVMTELWRLPRDFSVACARLRLQLQGLVTTYDLDVLVVEDFHFHQQKGSVTVAKAMYGLIGVARSLHGWHGLRVILVQAGVWGRQLTGLTPPRVMVGGRVDAWKRQVGWVVAQQAGPQWDWAHDPGWHRHDGMGLAFWAAHGLRMEQVIQDRGRVQ